VTVKRGLDVRDFVLTTFGGSGSLLACRLIDILGLQAVLVPPNPGNVSAFGLLTVDVKNDYVQTWVRSERDLDPDEAEAGFGRLREQADAALAAEGFAPADRRYARSADLRYFGQAFEVRVPVTDDELTATTAADVTGAFHDAHRALYGYDFRGDAAQPVEWVNLRVSGIGPIRRPELRELAGRLDRPPEPRQRSVCFDGEQFAPATIYQRPDLAAGDVVTGPAVIEEFGSTVPIHPGFVARVDRFGNLLITSGSK
jgi:N-methylhydantoinase A